MSKAEAATGGVEENTCNFIKRESLAKVLSCEFCKIFYRTPFLQRTCKSKNAFFKNTSLRTHVGPRTTFLQNTSGDYFYKNQAFPSYFFQLLNMHTS